MKKLRMIIGIVGIVLAAFILFQSCAASIGDALSSKDGVSGAAGTFVALLMIVAGIVAIIAKSGKAGPIVCIIFYALAGLLGVTLHGDFKDLYIWGMLCFIFALIFLITLIIQKKKTASVPTTNAGEVSNIKNDEP